MNIKQNEIFTTDVILHAFDWSYQDVAEKAGQISQLGYRSVLVSPPMKSLKSDPATKWWQRYQPQDYRVIDNQLGNTEQFIEMITALTKVDVQVYVDVVFNHMANESSERLDLQYPSHGDMESYQRDNNQYQKWRLFGDLTQPLFTEKDFVEAFGIEDWKNKWQVQNGRISGGPEDPGLPTLIDNEHVVEQQQHYLRALKKLGVKGFRIDAAKHMTLQHLNKVWTRDITQDVHIFGEIITDGGATKEEYQLFLQPYLQSTTLAAYDFPLFNSIFKAFSETGDMKSLINPYCFGQALSKSRAITFAITHDIPNNDVFSDLVMEERYEWLAYCYILGRDGGVPLIYSDLNTSNIRDESGKPRWQDAWKEHRMASMIRFHNKVHGQTMARVVGDEDYLVFSRGEEGIVAINKSEKTIQISIDWPWNMYDLLSDSLFLSQHGEFEFTLPAQSCLMMLRAKS
ncbi:alpha-amylase family glycosyl hydrolase [Vibrio sp. 99-8-1]|uniref:alpha-amylase family glycosyl hydrolase n=1 Tax=Vibrio sp. 99-8-1 TaxID=2607602 RepID=UPI0014939620|nr:alpha-amylase family glycosyl hydrolase [Vibrio sp. 99-8-1]NOI65155.1 alpha-amylase [Vibrio sp. 99-8-1]